MGLGAKFWAFIPAGMKTVSVPNPAPLRGKEGFLPQMETKATHIPHISLWSCNPSSGKNLLRSSEGKELL